MNKECSLTQIKEKDSEEWKEIHVVENLHRNNSFLNQMLLLFVM